MSESELLPHKRCWEAFEAALRAARLVGAPDVEVTLWASASALTRFAANRIHQNVAERHHAVSIRVLTEQRTARVTTNRLEEKSLRAAVEQAIAIARAQAPDPDLPPLAEPAPIRPVDRYHGPTARTTPEERARGVAAAIAVASAAGQSAAGAFSTEEHAEAIVNSRGVFAYYCGTLARFSVTVMAGESSGWAKQASIAVSDLDPQALTRRACAKAALGRNPRELPPGRYTVVLEPAAVLDLAGQLFGDFSATALQERRSFLNDRLGQKLFGANITVWDDVYHPLQSGPPFDGEGVPRQRLTLIEQGVPLQVARSRRAALREGTEPTGHGLPLPTELGEAPVNIVFHGAETSLEQLIACCRRGILVTRLWYIREVDPYDKIMTGLTRDGTFLVEDGEVACAVRNFRFNESIIGMLNRVAGLSRAVRASGEEVFDMVVPGMMVQDFRFTELAGR
ncbi:MAG: TldD/PmbA family protein [Firmicutes bacterium]|jgi:predicted Zn-dependent protease|nr:TldD/PmbA family protein [Bacillota bacterium]